MWGLNIEMCIPAIHGPAKFIRVPQFINSKLAETFIFCKYH